MMKRAKTRALFFAGVAFLPSLRAPLDRATLGAGLVMFSLSIAFSLIEIFLDRVAVVTFITPVGRNIKANLATTTPMRRKSIMVKGNWRARSLFYKGRQNCNRTGGCSNCLTLLRNRHCASPGPSLWRGVTIHGLIVTGTLWRTR